MTTYEITPGQRQQLLSDGFVLLPGALPPELLTRWRALAAEMERGALEAHAAGADLGGACVIEDPVGPRVMRVDDVLHREPDAVLDLLACPAMMAVARELCGRGSLPVQADVLYKHQHPHPVILWHQGAPHPRGFPYLNVGIYLDDADAGDGCVRYVPGTQHDLVDLCELSQAHGWEVPGMVEQPAKAGDILVQDMMILHGSPPRRSPGVRRTIYVELRPGAGIAESGVQSARWADLREQLMALVVDRADTSDWPEEWVEELPNASVGQEAVVEAISAEREPPIPAVYCAQPVEGPDYPVPADLDTPV